MVWEHRVNVQGRIEINFFNDSNKQAKIKNNINTTTKKWRAAY